MTSQLVQKSTVASSGAGPFNLDVQFDVDGFREALARGNYSKAGIKELRRGTRPTDAIDRALLDHRTRPATPFNTLARLFYLGLSVSENALREVVQSALLEQLFAAGLVRREENGVGATTRLEVHRDLFVCSDFVHFGRDVQLASDHVLGVGPGAISLGALTPQSAVESVLDLGTGGGIQALLAAQHAERVVATDISPRALNFAAMNARLNKIENIELRAGSFFDPVEGERFDHIIANPPFVISPRSGFVYRDGGLEGDAVSELVVRQTPAHLEEGGFAVILLNWHHATDDDWTERPQSWTRGNGCDVRWMRFDDEDPLSYATDWLRQERGAAADTVGALDRWLDYYSALGIARVALGAAVMRKCSTRPNWVRCDDIPISVEMTAGGDQMERIFDAEDLLQTLGDERQLLEQRLKLHPGHRLDQQMVLRDGGWAVESNKLHITNGMDVCAQADMPTMRFLAELDGTRSVREAAAPIAEFLGRTLEDVTPTCLDITKRMLRAGLLIRAS